MPWWGWLIVGCVVWITLAVGLSWWWMARKAVALQARMVEEFNKPLNDLPPAFGPYDRPLRRPERGQAFGPRHRP